jgi:hypothetical protein
MLAIGNSTVNQILITEYDEKENWKIENCTGGLYKTAIWIRVQENFSFINLFQNNKNWRDFMKSVMNFHILGKTSDFKRN